MRVFEGKVVANKQAKTATVAVTRLVTHPLYGKRIRKVKKYQVHDEIGVKVGERVRFAASKPYSRTKRWRILEPVSQISKSGKNGKKGTKK